MNNKLVILIIVIVILFILNKKKIKENYYGMDYIKQHSYFSCCQKLGCHHPACTNYLEKNKSKYFTAGYAYLENKPGNVYVVFSRMNFNNNKNEYFIRFVNKNNNNSILRKLNKNFIYDGDKVLLDNKTYVIKIYKNDYLYTRLDPFYRYPLQDYYEHENNYPYNFYMRKYGYIKHPTSDDFLLLYRKPRGRNRWRYYTRRRGVYIPLEKYDNKFIHQGERIKLPYKKKKYIFRKLDN